MLLLAIPLRCCKPLPLFWRRLPAVGRCGRSLPVVLHGALNCSIYVTVVRSLLLLLFCRCSPFVTATVTVPTLVPLLCVLNVAVTVALRCSVVGALFCRLFMPVTTVACFRYTRFAVDVTLRCSLRCS